MIIGEKFQCLLDGAQAKGENVYLYKNSNGTFEFIPEIGGAGGTSSPTNIAGLRKGGSGIDGSLRGCGGGSAGSQNSPVRALIRSGFGMNRL